jgi:hypothetical protein
VADGRREAGRERPVLGLNAAPGDRALARRTVVER